MTGGKKKLRAHDPIHDEPHDDSELAGAHNGWYHPDDGDNELEGEDRNGGPDHHVRRPPGDKHHIDGSSD